MKYVISIWLKRLAIVLEFFIALMLAAGVILLCFRMVTSLGNIPDLSKWPNYTDLLTNCFNLIIGVELIRMMYHHTPDTVFEVLLFAISRQIIVDHSSILGSLGGVCAIAILFATRKFLFCKFDFTEEIIFRGSMKVRSVNHLLGIHIPHEGVDDTLLDVFLKKCEEFDIEVGVGACVYFSSFGLRAAKIYNNKISRIEVIRSIH